MMEFEDQIRRALERREPPAGFAERVIARTATPPRPVRSTLWHGWRGWAAALAAAAFLVAGIDLEQRHRQTVREGEAARAQLLQALQITSGKLQKIQKHVRGAVR